LFARSNLAARPLTASRSRSVPLRSSPGYYQAQEFAIERSISKVEAGAQGEETKLPRGYLPTLTHSAHVFDQAAMSAAISDFCAREGKLIRERKADLLRERSPFK
jgi:predicted N-acyltransferase